MMTIIDTRNKRLNLEALNLLSVGTCTKTHEESRRAVRHCLKECLKKGIHYHSVLASFWAFEEAGRPKDFVKLYEQVAKEVYGDLQ